MAEYFLIKLCLEVSDKGSRNALRGTHRRPRAAMETQPDGSGPPAAVGTTTRPRGYHAQGDRHETRAVAHFRSDDKKRARLNCIRHLLKLLPYKEIPRKKIDLPSRSKKGAYDDCHARGANLLRKRINFREALPNWAHLTQVFSWRYVSAAIDRHNLRYRRLSVSLLTIYSWICCKTSGAEVFVGQIHAAYCGHLAEISSEISRS